MKDSATDDISLMKQLAKGHTGALSELYDRYNRLVFSVALGIVGDRAIAEEITLDVFVLVWQRADTYRPERAKVITWLAAITRYHAIDILRRQSVRPESKSVSWDYLSLQSAHNGREIEENVELSLQRKRIREAISQLPAEQQEALALAFFGGYTHQQISGMLNQSLGTVKTRIRLAMRKLRQALQADQPQPDKSEQPKTAYHIIAQDE